MKTWIMQKLLLFKFGVVREVITNIDCNVVSEVEYEDSKGCIIGHWAYGHFNPSHPINEDTFKYITLGDAE